MIDRTFRHNLSTFDIDHLVTPIQVLLLTLSSLAFVVKVPSNLAELKF